MAASGGPHLSPLPEGEGTSPFPRGEGGQGVRSAGKGARGLGPSRSLVVGLGNPILGDDGVGWHVAEEVSRVAAERSLPIEVDSLAVGGLALMERMVGYDRVVVVDAIRTGSSPIGAVTLLCLPNLPDPGAGHLSSGHDATLQTALAAGRALGAELPDDASISIVAIEAEEVFDFEEGLTPPVAAAVPVAAQLVLDVLG